MSLDNVREKLKNVCFGTCALLITSISMKESFEKGPTAGIP